jgi:hypothetical protein
MNKLTTTLRTGDLRPKERVLLQVHNEVAKDKTGKETLSEADIHALGAGWRPENNEQAREYNRYLEGWRLMNAAEIDAQTTYLSATVALLRARSVIDMSVSKDAASALKFCKEILEKRTGFESGGSPLDLVLQNSGLELKYVIHCYAFESLSEDLQKDVLALYPDARTEPDYLTQEETIASVLNGKETLSKEAKEKLADAIVDSMHNKYASIFKKFSAKTDLQEEYFFSGYFADLPALEVLNKWAFYNHQMPGNAEDLLRHIPEDKEYANESEEVQDVFESLRKELTPRLYAHAEQHGKNVGDLLRETLLRWFDDGLFTTDFTPLCISKGKGTCNGVDTKLPHRQVFKGWLKAKRASEQTIQGLIDSGALKVTDRVETIKRFSRSRAKNGLERNDEDAFKRTVTLITGESLYALPGDFSFANDYTKQADDLEGLGGLVLFLRERSFVKQYGVLLEFVELFKRLSTVYEIDLTYKITNWLSDFRNDIELVNGEILMVAEKLREASYQKHDAGFLVEIFVEDMLIDLEKVKPSNGRAGKYFREIGQVLGSEFGSYEAEEDETED